ncbi:MAG: glycosyltransferase [Vulcanimicrobiaceae bacterium]
MPSRVVIIMPIYNEARHLRRVLGSIAAQTIDHKRLFLVAVDGNSSDGSPDIVRAWSARSEIATRIMSNPRRKIPVSLNLGLQQATDEDVIVRLDAHSIYGVTYIADAIRAIEDAPSDVGCIGCAQIPVPGATFEERVVEALYTNPVGLGGADFRLGDDVREVDSVYLGVWRPGVLKRAGGFNETMEANEDGEMAARIRQRGYRIVRVPLPCRFLIKRGIWSSIYQWNRYGYWRAKMLQRNPQFVRLRHLASTTAALLIVGLACSPMRLIVLPAFGVYTLFVLRWRPKGQPLPVTVATLAFFPALQFAFACGMLTGLLTGRGRDWPPISSRVGSAQIRS